MNVDLPHRARLNTLTLRVEGGTNANVNLLYFLALALYRIPLRLTIPATAPDQLVIVGGTNRQRPGPFEFTAAVNPSLAEVDTDTFRYVLAVSAAPGLQINGYTVRLRAIDFIYTFDS
jgi:hypothetical protein